MEGGHGAAKIGKTPTPEAPGTDHSDAGLIDELVRRMVAALAPERTLLFGSRARGDARPDSDYDLLVVARTALPPAERSALLHRALAGLGVSKDLIVLSPEEFARYGAWSSSVERRAIEEGRVLHEAA